MILVSANNIKSEPSRLAALARLEILDSLNESQFDDITLLAAQICEVPIALISFVDEHRQWFKSKIGISTTETAREIAFCTHTIQQRVLFEVNDASKDSRFSKNPLVTNAPNIRFYAGMPLTTQSGHAVGTLCVIDQEVRSLNDRQKSSLALLAKQVMQLLETRLAIRQMTQLNQQHEYALSVVNNQLEASLEAIPDMVWVKNLDGQYTQCNRSFERCLGLCKKDILGKFDTDFFDAESAAFYRKSDLETLENNFVSISEEWISFADGYHGLFEVTKSVTRDAQGQAVGIMSMAHDITQRKQADLKARAHREAMQALNEMAATTNHKDYKEQIRLALGIACQYFGMNVGMLTRIEEDACTIEVQHSPEFTIYDGMDFPIQDSYCRFLLDEEDVVFVQDIDKTAYASEKCYQLMGYRAFIGIKLMQDKTLYGGLIFCDDQARFNAFETVDFDFIQLLSRWMMNIIRRNQLLEEVKTSNKRVELALRGADLGLWDVDLQTGKAVLNERWAEMLGYRLEELDQSMQTWKSLLHPEDAEYAIQMVEAHLAGETDELNIEFRMQHKEGHAVWIHDRGRVFERDAFNRPLRMVGTNLVVTARKNTEEEIKRLAFYDVLTNLPNRRLLLDRFQHALTTTMRSKQYGALIFIDLDNFKRLNDTLGHDKGDALLKAVATRLLSCLRDCDTVARFGGDEFVVMLDKLDTDHAKSIKQVEVVGDKIIDALNQAYDLDGQLYYSSPTLGATLFNGQADTVDDTLKRADMAMYQAKNAGKNCLRFFDQDVHSTLIQKNKLEEDLRVAIDTNQFSLFYQPQVDIHGRITGAEALIRWHHPKKGLVSPLEFIPLAEETGLIIQLGHWVIETGCQQLVAWAEDPQSAPYNLSINVSAKQFHQSDFVEQVLETLERTGANPHLLKLELTESMLVDDVDDVITKMSKLQLKGVRFSLDDFGTGFSSLSFLKLLPLNQLKIDKSFVRDVLTDANDAVIAKTIVALANSLGLTVIAEGVEIEGHRDFLADNGCFDYQGYLFSRPLTIEDFENYRQSLQSKENSVKS